LKAFLFPNCFLGILVQREIIANASFVSSGFLPRIACKFTHFSRNKARGKKKVAEKVAGFRNNAYICNVKHRVWLRR
ncbi:MAG: hypothetical protein IJV45_04275, partial [Prevotella sp.]|nr:hypothetical protein [Prevotella sp.]